MLFNILHAECPDTLLREAYRIVAAGGRLGISRSGNTDSILVFWESGMPPFATLSVLSGGGQGVTFRSAVGNNRIGGHCRARFGKIAWEGIPHNVANVLHVWSVKNVVLEKSVAKRLLEPNSPIPRGMSKSSFAQCGHASCYCWRNLLPNHPTVHIAEPSLSILMAFGASRLGMLPPMLARPAALSRR